MGNSVQNKDLGKDYEELKYVEHLVHGKFRVYRNITNGLQVSYNEMSYPESDEQLKKKFEDTCTDLQQQKMINHTNLARLVFLKTDKEDFCFSKLIIKYAYEYFPTTLYDQFQYRTKQKSQLLEPEVLYLVQSGLQVVQLLKENRVYYDMRIQDIMFNEKGELKFYWRIVDYQNIYQQFFQKNYDNYSLISPNLLQSLNNQHMKPAHDPEKSMIYVLGLLILQIASLKEIKNLYNFNNFTTNQDIIQDQFQIIQNIYSNNVYYILQTMTVPFEDKRPNCQQLIEYINILCIKKQIKVGSRITLTNPLDRSISLRSMNSNPFDNTKPQSNINAELKSSNIARNVANKNI